MSGMWRWKKVMRDMAASSTEFSRISTCNTTHLKRGFANFLNGGGRRLPVIGGALLQARYKWEHGGGSSDDLLSIRRIRAEANCPRCSKQMDLVFSNRHLIPPSTTNTDAAADCPMAGDNSVASTNKGGGGAYQAVNLCPGCKTAYYFRPYKMAPLQGSFVEIEIGRVKRI